MSRAPATLETNVASFESQQGSDRHVRTTEGGTCDGMVLSTNVVIVVVVAVVVVVVLY